MVALQWDDKPAGAMRHPIGKMITAHLQMPLETLTVDDTPQLAAEPLSVDDRLDPDRELVQLSVAGDRRAFERLYRRHLPRIYGLCCRLVNGDRARAEQATQDAFVRAWERLASFRGDALFSTWLHRLTVNVVLGEHRMLKRWVSFDEEQGDGEAATAEASAVPVVQSCVNDRMDLERALAKLPPGARAVMILHDVEGYQHQEIASMTGIAVGTSKAQLHRARRLMKEMLS